MCTIHVNDTIDLNYMNEKKSSNNRDCTKCFLTLWGLGMINRELPSNAGLE